MTKMLRCDRIFVEGQSDAELLKRLLSGHETEPVIESRGGKSNVIREFIKGVNSDIKSSFSPLQSGNVCYIVDGDGEGYEGSIAI